ncbi:MAG: family 43 glycosylhydrolase [Dysgonamonadaceae bacterium]|jgi:GH43 family beta-xylosidase|nr:family 43 glycosylhydrolase [Dysgonamonadaceae bacterium]
MQVCALTKLPLADPFVLYHGNKYYAYGTSDANGIAVYTSDDLKFWTKQPNLALHKNDSYADRWFWAPEVYYLNGRFYMYYSADEHICVATSDSPLGPFVQDVKQPMLAEKGIDNSLFIDDDGKAYLFFVRFTDGNAIWMAELESDYKTIKTNTMRLCFAANTSGWEADMGKVNEGPFVIKHDGNYYLTYSANDYRSQNYGVGYAWSRTITGDWVKYSSNPVLRKPNGLFGSGHHCLFRDKDNNLKMAFHAHKSGTDVNPRETYITSVGFTVPPRGMPVLTVSPGYQPAYILNTAFGGDKQPLMGWSSWNANRVNINEALIKATADSMVSLNLNSFGYKWVNIDDGYFNGRNAEGHLQVNSKFPNGMKAISDYIHAKGLRAGIYSEIGRNTCASMYDGDEAGKNSGLYGHEEQDLRLFFDTWNYDFIKVDYCGGIALGLNERTTYTNVGNIIKNLETGLNRDLRYNICRWSFPGTWARDIADSWRVSGDISDNFGSIHSIIELNTYLAPYCSPGKYNDMDMLQLGRGLNNEEEKTHFGMWAIMSSPLIIGCNFAGIRQSSLAILKNAEIIAVNQDTLGLQAEVVAENGKTRVYAKPLETAHGKVRAVALYNAAETPKTIRVNFKDIWLGGKAQVRDLWQHSDLGEFTDYYETLVPAHGTAMLRIEGESVTDKLRYQGEYAYMNKFAAIDLAENARFERTPHFLTSGGAVTHWLGNSADNWAEYRDVYVSQGGNYTFKLYYISAENRNLTVTVNGVDYQMTGLNSGGWDKRASAGIQIQLNTGSNVIRLSNATAFAPNVDKFELIPEGGNIGEDSFDQVDTSGQFPAVSSADNSSETWYNVLFKESEGALQDMGDNQFLLTKALDGNLPAQQWKVIQVNNPSGEYKYRLVNRSGRSLVRVSVPETSDGFYKTTSAAADWVTFRITATGNNNLQPAWEMERQGANNRRLNQYNPMQTAAYDKNISEWTADDHGNPLIFVPAKESTAIRTLQNGSKAKILVEGKHLSIEGNDIKNVYLYAVSGILLARKTGGPYGFTTPAPGCYLAVIKYNNNNTETIKVII